MKDKTSFSHVFGPVPSRRLGFSLGIDLVPYKICSYDCIYCQLGRTTEKTLARKEYIPLETILEEVGEKLKEDIGVDYITLSGSGEPTLYSRLSELIAGLKKLSKKPVAVLTNGSLLWDRKVQQDIMEADLVIPSVDAGDESLFQYVNRPHPGLSFEKVSQGIADFRQHYKGRMWIEVLLLNGVTSINSEVSKIAALIRNIHPHKIQLNTAVRPPAENFAEPLPRDLMYECATLFGKNVEVITDFTHIHDQGEFHHSREEIKNLLKRRPCSLDDISKGLFMHPNEVLKYLEQLIHDGCITTTMNNNIVFYTIK
jgi:wyosine [tRNA(Phe)-imidazoG37] synthetase (radical SAM superfamily)